MYSLVVAALQSGKVMNVWREAFIADCLTRSQRAYKDGSRELSRLYSIKASEAMLKRSPEMIKRLQQMDNARLARIQAGEA